MIGGINMKPLIDEFLKPETEPDDYKPEPDVITFRKLENGQVVIEVIKKNNKIFGFHYRAWVAWRDAGNEVRSHSWHTIEPKDNLLTDTASEAQKIANKSIIYYGLSPISEWSESV